MKTASKFKWGLIGKQAAISKKKSRKETGKKAFGYQATLSGKIPKIQADIWVSHAVLSSKTKTTQLMLLYRTLRILSLSQ